MTRNSISKLVLGSLAALALAIGTTSSASAQWYPGSQGYGGAEHHQPEAHGPAPMPHGGYYGAPGYPPRVVVTPPVYHGSVAPGGWGGRGDHGWGGRGERRGWGGRGDHGGWDRDRQH